MTAIDPVFPWIAAFGIALLFAASAVHKVRDWGRFTGALANYRVLPERSVALVAPVVVGLECLVVLLLLNPALRSAGAILAAAMLAIYAAALAINLQRGRTSIDCGCVGAGQRRHIHRGMVVRNLALAAGALCAAWPASTRPLTRIDALTIAGSVLVCALLYLAADTLASTTLARRSAT